MSAQAKSGGRAEAVDRLEVRRRLVELQAQLVRDLEQKAAALPVSCHPGGIPALFLLQDSRLVWCDEPAWQRESAKGHTLAWRQTLPGAL